MDIERLQHFRVIARCGSLSAAARELGLSQPAVTGCVQTLEREFDAQLLVRTSRGVQLTDAGRVVVELAETLDVKVSFAHELIAQIEGGEAGQFTIGCHASLGSYFFPDFMPSFSLRYPDIEVTIRNASSSDVLQGVRDRELDFGLVVNPTPYDELVLVPLFHDRVTFFTKNATASTLEEAHELLSSSSVAFMERMPQAIKMLGELQAEGIEPNKRLPCGEHELVRAMTQGGAGIGILPWRVATMGPGSLNLLHGAMPAESDWIALCWRADRPKTLGSNCFKNALVRAGRQLGEVS